VTSLDYPIVEDTPLSDGISTQRPHVALMVTQADCQAAIFYDPINHVLSNVHSGWRSSVLNIYGATVEHMKHVYGSKPEDLLVCVSPSLGPESSQFINYKTELPEAFWEFQVKPLYFDFWSISEEQLKRAGVLSHHIQIAGIDTYANEEDYFSYRRSNKCGRQGTVCALK
jgi:YfiH family protein